MPGSFRTCTMQLAAMSSLDFPDQPLPRRELFHVRCLSRLPQQLGAMGEYLQQDLRAALDACHWGRYDVAVSP